MHISLSSTSWYEVANGADIWQGSLLRAFPVVKPPKNVVFTPNGQPQPVSGRVRIHDIVVLSQSCDLAQNKSGLVLVAPVVGLEEADKLAGKIILDDPERLQRLREQIRRGNQPPLHMLAACDVEHYKCEIQVVDFRQSITVSHAHLVQFATEANSHVRLRSPYREHLSQAFARFFMRVAMDSDAEIPPFCKLP